MIELENVTKTYYTGESSFQALKGVSINITRGENVAIVGPSGSGKSTLMNILGLLDKPTEGQYKLGGEDVLQLTADEQAYWRNRKIGFVFQAFFLLPRLTALQNVMLPLQYAREKPTDIEDRAMRMLERMEIKQFYDHRPNELSGGQKQRVAIARALVTQPEIILADEPTGALDSHTSEVVLELMFHQARGTTVVIITHDHEVADRCQRKIIVRDGLILEKGKP
jgi:ABC-type lipoprotein export system ATPase subunit